MILRTTHRGQRSGAHLVETAFVLVLVLLFLFAIFEYGRFLFIRQTAQDAVREAARMASVANVSDPTSYNYVQTTDVQNMCFYIVNGLGLESTPGNALVATDVNVFQIDVSTGNNLGSWTSTPFGGAIAVQINAVYRPMFPTFLYSAQSGQSTSFLGNIVPVTVTSSMRFEANL